VPADEEDEVMSPSRRPLDQVGDATRAAAAARWLRRSASAAAREAVATAVSLCGIPLVLGGAAVAPGGGHRSPPVGVHGHADTPVILVHGFAASPACWSVLRRALHADGRMVVSFAYAPWASSVEELAARLTDTVEDLLEATGAGHVHLVGHSLGGVVIAQALTDDRLSGGVHTVVTLGAPFGGCPWAWLFPMRPLIWALRPGSPLLRRLAAWPPPPGVRWLAFGSALDPVVPADHAVPANRQATCVMVETAGHAGMLLDRAVVERIVAETAVPAPDVDPVELLGA
jgi:triacylglycerol lipase